MNASFLYPPAGKDDVAPKPSSRAAVDLSATVANQADRACCCPAKEVVRVIMPPTPTRPYATDLLLCGHHYRVSRRALAAAHAVVHELPGTPRDTAAWIYDDHDLFLAPAERTKLSGERADRHSTAGAHVILMKHIKGRMLTVVALGAGV